jgi:hypothetical protein
MPVRHLPPSSICRNLRRAVAFAAVPVLGSCGGGVYWGSGGAFGDGFDDTPPSVTLATSATSVAPGQAVRVVAAASDESGIDSVLFYRVDGVNATTTLGTDASAPYEWLVVAPTDGRNTLDVVAHAIDNRGNTADSAVLRIAITP